MQRILLPSSHSNHATDLRAVPSLRDTEGDNREFHEKRLMQEIFGPKRPEVGFWPWELSLAEPKCPALRLSSFRSVSAAPYRPERST